MECAINKAIDFKVEFKQKFLERYSQLTNLDKFLEYSQRFLRRAIRVNTLKASVKEIKQRLSKDWKLIPIPWCKEGFWIEHKQQERRDIGNTLEHALGYYYVQEAASMIPPLVLKPRLHSTVLDACAAPGSKSTQLAALLKNTGMLIANDADYRRIKPLVMNLQRCGAVNFVITIQKAQRIEGNFDFILLDAPCSATGTIRKSLHVARMWNPNMIKRLASIQKRMIKNLFSCLKEDGILVYSTCTLEPEENEGVIDFLLRKFDNAKLERINLNLKRSSCILEFNNQQYTSEVKKCLRIWPQDNDTEGFFVAKIRKTK